MKERLDQISLSTIALVSTGDEEVLINQAKELVEKLFQIKNASTFSLWIQMALMITAN